MSILTMSEDSWIKEIYETYCRQESDIYMHLPILYKYAKRCNHVTEMGARSGKSTSAFLYANPKKFVSYDYQYSNPETHLRARIAKLIGIFNKARQEGANCEYIGADVLTVEIDQTDLLFIDTWHCYSQLKKELELHAGKVNKYIIFHDVFTYGNKGEGYPAMDSNHPQRSNLDGTGGIRPAIDEFIRANRIWELDFETTVNNGLLIIKKSLTTF